MRAGATAANFCDVLLAAGAPGDPAVVDGGREYTYADLRSAAATLAGALARLGVAPRSHIAVVGPNSFFWVAAYLAALKLGVAVPLSERSTVADLAGQSAWAGCAAVLLDRRTQRRVGDAFAGLPQLTDALLAGDADPFWPETARDAADDAALMFTSGTTARPKAVRITHGNLAANTGSITSYLGLEPDDRMLVVLPFHYCFGASLLHTHLAVGASVVICNTFTFPETALGLIEEHRCTGLAGVPSSFQLLLRASSYRSRPLPTLRRVLQAGGRLPPEAIRELLAAQPGSALYVMYGQTEATARLSYLPPDALPEKIGSIGKGIPGVELTVVDEDGRPVPVGGQGEIVARGANISPGYYRDPGATAEKFPGGALRTGDLATVDADGFIYIVGRRGDFIKSWGYRVAPQQVEEAALAHPGVAEAAVVGMPDPEAGEAISLAVVPMQGALIQPAELLAFLSGRLPRHMLPRTVQVLAALPVNANGKIVRSELRRMLSVALPRQETPAGNEFCSTGERER